MIALLAKLDGLLLALIGAVGYALYTNDQEGGAKILAGVVIVVGFVAVVAYLFVRRVGGHQAPRLAALWGHSAAWFVRASILIGLGWLGAYAAAKADVKDDGLRVALSVAVFGGVSDFVKPLKDATDRLRPAAFGKKSIQDIYGAMFEVKSDGSTDPGTITARSAVHDDLATVYDDAGAHTSSISGWASGARANRLEQIARALN